MAAIHPCHVLSHFLDSGRVWPTLACDNSNKYRLAQIPGHHLVEIGCHNLLGRVWQIDSQNDVLSTRVGNQIVNHTSVCD